MIASSTTYYPFGMPQKSRALQTYRFGFNGKEKDPEWTGTEGSHLAFRYRIHDARIGRFLSIDPLTKDYPWNSPYAFSENRVIDAVELEGAEYLRADEARIKVTGGAAHINLDNFNTITRNRWQARDERGNWPKGSVGYPTAVAQLSSLSLPASPNSPVSLDNTYGAVNPSYNPTQSKQNYTSPSGKANTPTVSGRAKGAAGIAVALNAVNWAL